jgi:hypothetical protein
MSAAIGARKSENSKKKPRKTVKKQSLRSLLEHSGKIKRIRVGGFPGAAGLRTPSAVPQNHNKPLTRQGFSVTLTGFS